VTLASQAAKMQAELNAERQLRKQLVFPIMYGWHAGATPDEVIEWRSVAADFINHKRVDVPLTLEAFREWKRELSAALAPPGSSGC
jgi:hypothetical protein